METFNLPHNITHTLLQKLTYPGTMLKSNLKFKREIRTDKPSGRPLLKQAITYVADAIGEGLKQNLLGADINMEYLTLTARALISAYFKAPSNHIKNTQYTSQHLSGAYCQTDCKSFN